jgi:RNA polymerase sigma factor (sigma-70 family)
LHNYLFSRNVELTDGYNLNATFLSLTVLKLTVNKLESDSATIEQKTTDLVTKCREGNEAAFRELYHQYNKAMFNICVRMLNNKVEAQDILQEGFISAFSKIKQFSGKATFGSWLKRIIINKCIDALKQRSLVLSPLNDRDVAEEQEEPEEDLDYNVADVTEAVAQLPDGYRVILSLYLFEDYSHKLIAEQLGISEGTSKSQYSRARKKLIYLIKKNRHER